MFNVIHQIVLWFDFKFDFNMYTVPDALKNLPVRKGYSNTANPWNVPNYPVLEIDSWTKKNDFTFSLGRDTNYGEVNQLLVEAGCYKKW